MAGPQTGSRTPERHAMGKKRKSGAAHQHSRRLQACGPFRPPNSILKYTPVCDICKRDRVNEPIAGAFSRGLRVVIAPPCLSPVPPTWAASESMRGCPGKNAGRAGDASLRYRVRATRKLAFSQRPTRASKTSPMGGACNPPSCRWRID